MVTKTQLNASLRITSAYLTEDECRARAIEEMHKGELNKGHGHVFPRADNLRAKCGGPGSVCAECNKDKETKEFMVANGLGNDVDWEMRLKKLKERRTPQVELNASLRLMAALKDGSGEGNAAAGIHMMAASTGRYLLGLRGPFCASPNTWACFAGTVEPNETAEEAARREFREETGHIVVTPLHFIHTFKHPDPEVDFQFHNYFTIVPDEFEPHLCEETQDYKWAAPGEFPEPLHPGFKDFLRTHGDHLQDYSDSTDHLIDPEEVVEDNPE